MYVYSVQAVHVHVLTDMLLNVQYCTYISENAMKYETWIWKCGDLHKKKVDEDVTVLPTKEVGN